jgi:uracil-DNA glycosylase family 4
MKISNNLTELQERLKGCGICPKMVRSRIEVLGIEHNQPVSFRGNDKSTFMFIGQAPGRLLEKMVDKTNIKTTAFSYGSGDTLSRVLTDAGYLENEVFITNVCKCSTPSDNIFIDEDICICTKLFLENEIRLLRPKALIVMGKKAQEWFFKYCDENIISGIKVFKVFHPAYVSYSPDQYDGYVRTLTSIRETILNDKGGDEDGSLKTFMDTAVKRDTQDN